MELKYTVPVAFGPSDGWGPFPSPSPKWVNCIRDAVSAKDDPVEMLGVPLVSRS